jgi:hypothetical protein
MAHYARCPERVEMRCGEGSSLFSMAPIKHFYALFGSIQCKNRLSLKLTEIPYPLPVFRNESCGISAARGRNMLHLGFAQAGIAFAVSSIFLEKERIP